NKKTERPKERKNRDSGASAENSRLYHETKKGIWAVVFLGVAVILILARFNNAGPAGDLFYRIFNNLFGVGYYLLPLVLIILSIVYILSERHKVYQTTFAGAIIFILFSLGLIDIISEDKAGIIGMIVGYLEVPFGYTASIVVSAVLIIISLLVTFNFPVKKAIIALRKNPEDADFESGNDEEFESEEVEETIIATAEAEQSQKQPESDILIASSDLDKKQGKAKTKLNFKNYVPPPLSLLKSSIEKPTAGDLRANANIIKRTFDSFGIPVEMGEINIGPKFTRYTLKPAEGIKLSRITALNQDLSLALAAHPIRIEAPIPGKSLVGVEVPNKTSAIVRLGSLMTYPEFASSGSLGFILGRDVSGEPIFANIEKMPHLLIAGSSGSGKSISIHSLLISLLYKNSPETLRLILIDPKRVELSTYSGLPHLMSPVITQPKKAIGVLRWLIEEMNRRYELLMHAGSRDIQSYNKKKQDDILPYVVIVVDELADLMVTYGREVEGSVVRLAQMARATGLHLIVSTQRPSVEIVTGLIKANITSRMALQLPSQVDSRTILDTSGAEKLLGGGDMLFISSEISKPKRIQGAYLSEEEVNKVTTFIRENNKDLSSEDDVILENGDSESGGPANDYSRISDDMLDKYTDENGDDLLDEAVQVVIEAKKASASLLQRRLKVGYARAARLLDIMEARGIIGPGDGAKPREVYIGETNDL
ncbi:DNA translocase FtsK 4TM domain-containing protein, partial [Candidatus Wolfebacteria bacterium]|nr:DNA translocase FtsK 4TM domain-containing protein [Candidatus Wolfebacteria bacterium]